jgi:hypothetical protein
MKSVKTVKDALVIKTAKPAVKPSVLGKSCPSAAHAKKQHSAVANEHVHLAAPIQKVLFK